MNMPASPRTGRTQTAESWEGGDEDGSYLTDPEQLRDELPQPFRMIDKVVERLLDHAWQLICEREARRAAAAVCTQSRGALVRASARVTLPASANCLACTHDGEYVFMGHACGLSVLSARDQRGVACWQGAELELTSLQCTPLGQAAHLIATLDDMGVCRIFAFHEELLYLIKSINETNEENQRNNCSKFELSRGGDYMAIVMECCGEAWLEIYKVPKESWVKELDGVRVENATRTDVKFLPLGMVLRIKAPEKLSGTSLKTPFDVLHRTDEGRVIGSGQHHMISVQHFERQNAVFKSAFHKHLKLNVGGTEQTEGQTSQCTFHFLHSERSCPFLLGHPEGAPAAVCLWWSHSHNLLQYVLPRTPKDKPDSTSSPDVVWPNSQEILCSAVSKCTCYMALGLAQGIFTLWDRHYSLPCCVNVISVSSDGDLSRLVFMDSPSLSPSAPSLFLAPYRPALQVVVTCKSGTCLAVRVRRGENPQVTKLANRSADFHSFPAVVLSVPFLQKMALFMYKDGSVLLQDSSDGSAVCSLVLPDSHILASPWRPAFVLDPVNHNLLVRGDKVDSEDDDDAACLFVFSLCRYSGGESSFQTPCLPQTLEDMCNLYLQDRAMTLKDRNEAIEQSWNQLHQHSSAASSNRSAVLPTGLRQQTAGPQANDGVSVSHVSSVPMFTRVVADL